MSGYVAASNIPWKLIKNPQRINVPYHIQFIPTNRCNGNCSWCSCKNVDRGIELETQECIDILNYFNMLGAKAITITGGGEPTLHKEFEKVFKCIVDNEYKIGLVTNGILLSKGYYSELLNNNLTWCRISITDTESGGYDFNRLLSCLDNLTDVDVGISFTVTGSVDMNTVKKICTIAREYINITHIRFTQDILNAIDPFCLTAMERIKQVAKQITDKAIIQFRDKYTIGMKNCFISKVKPVINCDGYIYPCCGAQYAIDEKNVMPESMRMCYWNDFENYEIFDGSICKVCYYNQYNEVIKSLKNEIEHEDFI